MRRFLIYFFSLFFLAFYFLPSTFDFSNAQSSCEFRPVAFVVEKRADGKLYPLKSPNPHNWGIIYDKVKDIYGYKPENLASFNKLGEFDPCGDGACDVGDKTFAFTVFPEAQYLIKQGDTADVTLMYDRTAFKIIEQCLPYQKCAVTTQKPINVIKDTPVACRMEYRFGWVVERINYDNEDDTNKCSLENSSCAPQSLKVEFRDKKRIRVGWSNPNSKCSGAKNGETQVFVDVHDSQKQRICSKNQTLDSLDTSTDCVLGRDKIRPNNKDIKEFGNLEKYTITASLNNKDCSSPASTIEVIYNTAPTSIPEPSVEPSNIPPSPIPPTPTSITGRCGLLCVYSENVNGQTKCFEGNCLDGSDNCSLNKNCGFVAECTNTREVTCPGHVTPAPSITTPPPPPPLSTSLPYTIEIRNTNIKPITNAKELITSSNFRPNAKIEYYDIIYNSSVQRGWNPALVLAIWLEETGGSTTTVKKFGGAGFGASLEHLGCNQKKGQFIQQNLSCFFDGSLRINLKNEQFDDFMKSYCGPRETPTCASHTNFVVNLGKIYDKLVPQGTYGARRILTRDVNLDGVVNTLDYIRVLNRYGQNDVNDSEDINGDFRVNPIDLSSILENLGTKDSPQL